MLVLLGVTILSVLFFTFILPQKHDLDTLKPTSDIPIADINYYYQRNPIWTNDIIGKSNSTIGAEGCLLTCVSISAEKITGKNTTPKDFNTAMTKVDGFDEKAILLWEKVGQAVESLCYQIKESFSVKTIEDDLKGGYFPLVKVKLGGIGPTHWVMIIGSKDGEFMIHDPLSNKQTALPLSTHGKIYAYRIIVKN